MSLTIKLSSITISVTKMAEMVNYYNNLLGTELLPFEAYETIFYRGKLAGLEIIFCPNNISGINSEQNKHQFNFEVNNLAEMIRLSNESGGKQKGEIVADNNKLIVAVIDPDGNTLELIQNVAQESRPEQELTRDQYKPGLARNINKPALQTKQEEPTLNINQNEPELTINNKT